jgi:hypothetical protein
MNKSREPLSFGVMDIARLVGIQPTLLNKFIQRGKYGIRASASTETRPRRGKERHFAREDVYGIALVYWLFESGLRSEAIQYVLNQICNGRLHSHARDAASKVPRRPNDMLVIAREPRMGYAKYPAQSVDFLDARFVAAIVNENQTGLYLVIPVGRLYASLREQMEDE